MTSCWGSSMAFLKFVAFLFGACFLVGLLVEIGGISATLPEKMPQPKLRSSKLFLVRERGTATKFHNNFHPIYVSKRRVPNGPDPIHNRRAGKSGRPAGRA